MNIEPITPYVVAAVTVGGALLGETVSIEPSTIMGGGGLTMGGVLLHAIWRYLKRQEKLQDLNEDLVKAQLKSLEAESAHREAERSHWRLVEHRLEKHGESLREIHQELRPPTGPHTPIHGIDIREPGEPEPLGPGYRPPARPPRRG